MYNARERTGESAACTLAQTDENAYARATATHTRARDLYERESLVQNGRSPAETPSFAAAQIARGF